MTTASAHQMCIRDRVYPAIIEAGSAGGTASFLGVPVTLVSYASSITPILISMPVVMWINKDVYKRQALRRSLYETQKEMRYNMMIYEQDIRAELDGYALGERRG